MREVQFLPNLCKIQHSTKTNGGNNGLPQSPAITAPVGSEIQSPLNIAKKLQSAEINGGRDRLRYSRLIHLDIKFQELPLNKRGGIKRNAVKFSLNSTLPGITVHLNK